MNTVAVSIIIPCYNGERVLGSTVGALADYLNGLGKSWELLVVDDASTDRTPDALLELGRELTDTELRVIRHETNRGKGCSVRDGMTASRGEYRIFTDVDLDYPPSEIGKILSGFEAGADVVVASRVASGALLTLSPWHIQYMHTRHLMSRLLNKCFRNLFVRHITDSQAGLKGFTAEAAEKVFSRTMINGFSFDIEALYVAHLLGLQIKEVPVHCVYGSQPSTVEFGKAGLALLRDMIATKLNGVRGVYDRAGTDCCTDQERKQKYLVVTADDYGLSEGVDQGIIQGVRSRQISSVSVMASKRLKPWPAENRQDVGFGLHVNLTEGRPTGEANGLGPILTSQGEFSGLSSLAFQCVRSVVSTRALTEEILAQAAVAERAGFTLEHIDGHEHIQHLPCVREAVSEAARRLNIRWVRVSDEKLGYECGALRCTLKKLALTPFVTSAKVFFRSQGLLYPDRFFGIALVRPGDFESALDRAVQESGFGVNEIVVHPGAGEVDQEDRLGGWRQKSLESLLRFGLCSSARKAGLVMTKFSSIKTDSNSASIKSPENCK